MAWTETEVRALAHLFEAAGMSGEEASEAARNAVQRGGRELSCPICPIDEGRELLYPIDEGFLLLREPLPAPSGRRDGKLRWATQALSDVLGTAGAKEPSRAPGQKLDPRPTDF